MGLLRSVFASAGVPFEEHKGGEWPYITAKVKGWGLVLTVIDCENANPEGACQTILVQSGSTSAPVSSGIVEDFNRKYVFAHAVYDAGNAGTAYLSQLIQIGPGVTPGFIETGLLHFIADLQGFSDVLTGKK